MYCNCCLAGKTFEKVESAADLFSDTDALHTMGEENQLFDYGANLTEPITHMNVQSNLKKMTLT